MPPVRGAGGQARIAEKAETVGLAVVPVFPQTLRVRARAELVRAVADVPDKVPPAVAVRVRARTGGPSAHPRSVAGARSRGPVGGAMIVRLAAAPDASPPLQPGGSVAASARAVRLPVPAAVALGQIPIPELAPGRAAIAVRRAVTAIPVVHEVLAPGQTATVRGRHPVVPTGGAPAVSDPRPGSPTVIVRAARPVVPAKAEVATAVRIRGAVTTVAVMTAGLRVRGDAMMTVRAVDRPRADRVRRVATAGTVARRAAQPGIAPVMRAHSVASAAPAIGPTWSPRSEWSSHRCPRTSMLVNSRAGCVPSCVASLRSWPSRPVPIC